MANQFLDKAGLEHYTDKMKAYVDGKVNTEGTALTTHKGDTGNPHKVTKTQVGLGNVLDVKQIPASEKGAKSGVATLDSNGKLTSAQLPAMKSVNGQSVVGSGNITIDMSLFKLAPEGKLPTTNIDPNKIYLVSASKSENQNVYAEYIYTGDSTGAYDATKWEKLGEMQSTIDIDTSLSTTSTNPVQNKVIKAAIDTLTTSVNAKVATSTYNTKMSTLDTAIADIKTKNTQQDTAINGKLAKTTVASASTLGLVKIGHQATDTQLPVVLDSANAAYVVIDKLSDTDIDALF